MYPFIGCIIFNYKPLLEHFNNYLSKPILTSEEYTNKYNFVMLISTIPLAYILFDNFALCFNRKFSIKTISFYFSRKLHTKKIKKNITACIKKRYYFSLQFLLIAAIIISLIFFLIYVYKLTGGQYIGFTESNFGAFNILGWLSILVSGSVFSLYSKRYNPRKKLIYKFLLMLIIMFWVLRIRMYCAMFVMMIMLCKHMEGMKLKRKHIALLFLCMSALLLAATLRFSSYRYGDFYYDLFTIFGEFALSGVSSYYLINNPFGYSNIFKFLDLVFQLLPSSMRPSSYLMEFHNFCVAHGHNPWPIGGIQFQGQMYFYFGIFFIIGEALVAVYLLYIRRKLNAMIVTPLVASFPIFCLVLPRLPIWTLRSMIFAMLAFYFSSQFARIWTHKQTKGIIE